MTDALEVVLLRQQKQIDQFARKLLETGKTDSEIALWSLGQVAGEAGEVWGKGNKAIMYSWLTDAEKANYINGMVTEMGDVIFCIQMALNAINKVFNKDLTLNDCVTASIDSVNQKREGDQ